MAVGLQYETSCVENKSSGVVMTEMDMTIVLTCAQG